MKYYCIHHLDAIDRKIFIEKHYINKFNIDMVWIEDFHPSLEVIQDHKRIHTPHAANNKYLNTGELSCYLKHKKAISMISDSNDYGFILEDDVEPPSFNFIEVVKDFYYQMEYNACDILFVGSFSIYDLKNINNKAYIYCNNNTLSRCAHAYIISNNCATKLINYLEEIKAPFDWQLNFAIEDLGLKSCWSYPHIYQRTEKKQIESLLRS